MTSQPT